MEGKGNDGKGDIPERDLWQTKQPLWDKLNNQYRFDFDCCANEENTKCGWYSDDFEKTEQTGNCSWMNPPFSKAYDMFKHYFDVVKQGVAIFRCDNMETKVWQMILRKCSWVFIPKGRVDYTPFEVGDMRKGNGTRFPSALIGYNVAPPIGLEGCTLYPENKEVEDGINN